MSAEPPPADLLSPVEIDGVGAWVVTEEDEPALLISTQDFDSVFVRSLTMLPTTVRSRIFSAQPTAAEELWFEKVSMLGIEEQLVAVKRSLEDNFGIPLRIDSAQIADAVRVIQGSGYVSDISHLLRTFGHCFSSRARAVLRESFPQM